MQPTQRQDYLDWLRIFAILGVLFYHAAMPFAAGEWWHIRNEEESNMLLEFNFWLSRFRMPLLFFISGSVTWFMIKKRSAGSFIGLRFRRLFIPLLFGMLVIVPPQIYMERLTQGFEGNFFDFYPNIFTMEPYPNGNTSWHHLWFIAYLFIYNVIAAPLFRWFTTPRGQAFLPKLDWFSKGQRIYLLVIPGILVYTSLILRFPQTNDLIHDWTYVPYWFLFLLIGFICILRPSLIDSLEKNRRTSLGIGLVLFIIMNYFRWNDIEPWTTNPGGWKSAPGSYAFLAIFPAISWFWVFALTGYGKKYLNRATTFSKYSTEAIYPFYIVHQTVIVILAYYVVQTSDDVASKYVFLSVASLIMSVAFYHLVVKRFNVMRFVFGLKPLKSHRTSTQPSPADQKTYLQEPCPQV